MKKIRLIVVLLFCFSAIHAQKLWTLEECIQYATDNNITIKQIQIQKENAEINLNTSQMSRLPDLNAGMGQNWSFGRTQMASGLYENQSQSNTSLSVNSSMPLFTGFRISNEIARNKLNLQAATENLAKAKEDLALRIASLFLQVLFDKEISRVNQEQLLLSQTQMTKTRSMVEAGKVPQSQLYDIEAQAAKDEVSVIQAKNNLALALLDLAQSLELQNQTGFDVYAPEINDVISEYMSSVQPPQIIYNNALNVKPVIKAQEYNMQSAEKALNIAKSGYLPSLNLNLNYGTNYFYRYNLPDNDPLQKNISLSNQFRNNASEYIGLSLNIPIFNRFSVRNQVRNAQLNINSQQLELDNVKKTLYKEIQTAYLNATAAQEKYRSSDKAVKAAAESFKYAQERYEVGKSSVFEFNEAKTKLVQSQSEQIQAKYDYIFRTKILDFYNGVPLGL
ncbi:MAG: TolC family protein [Dysgonamonadaceae bacterium]|jgi:outer membrane protein|nr:TolC family protein [Dysgonamonadaceae bacterium]